MDAGREQAWMSLLREAFHLIDIAEQTIEGSLDWSFGGGTVLMLRMNHRFSKDIDIFLTDPQVLGFFNPRISDAAREVSDAYEESSGHVKLYLAEGEIDFVAAHPLTDKPFEAAVLMERSITLERSGEIIAKKMWHRGHLATARDLFDFSSVFLYDPSALTEAEPFLARNAAAFLQLVQTRQSLMRQEFNAIDRRASLLTFEDAAAIAEQVLRPLVSMA